MFENGHQKLIHVLREDWITLHTNRIYHSWFISECNWEGVCDRFEEKSSLHVGFLLILHTCSGSETWYDIDHRDTHLFSG